MKRESPSTMVPGLLHFGQGVVLSPRRSTPRPQWAACGKLLMHVAPLVVLSP